MTNATAPRAGVTVRLRAAAWVAAALMAATITVPAAGLPPTSAPPGAAPARPALDVYFLVDATDEMGMATSEVMTAVHGINRRLAARTRLRHGYGVFRHSDLVAPHPRHVYERLSAIRPGGGPLPRVQYTGGEGASAEHVYGLDGALGNAHAPWTVFPEPAGFAPTARKLIVLVTSSAPEQEPWNQEMDDVVARLNKAGVAVATLWVRWGGSSMPDRGTELHRLATRTGAVARGAVDCDDAWGPDLRRGDPLVCTVWAGWPRLMTGFADALVARFAS